MNDIDNYYFISLGNTCTVKYNLDKFFGKKENLFFDWLITDINSVNKILSTKNISELINNDTLTRVGGNSLKNTSKISISTLNTCISLHDLPNKYNEDDLKSFKDKFIRRYNRLIKYIKSDKKIYFILKGKVLEHEREKLITNILNINENCDFLIVNLDEDNFKSKNFLSINLNNYILENKKFILEDYWKGEFIDWNKIFDFILQN